MVRDFAGHAAIVLRLAAAHARERELSVLADRERIAHDLHDHVIQKLFAAGMDLQGSIARARSPELVERLTRTVDDLQSTIDDIPQHHLRAAHPSGQVVDFRQRIQRLIAKLTDDRPSPPRCGCSGR